MVDESIQEAPTAKLVDFLTDAYYNALIRANTYYLDGQMEEIDYKIKLNLVNDLYIDLYIRLTGLLA